MAKVKVKVRLGSLIKMSRELVSRKVQQEIGEEIVARMREAISKGLSPVKGEGRFISYVAQRKAPPQASKSSKSSINTKLYPYSVKNKFPDKKIRPINLSLDDSFLDTLKWNSAKDGPEVGHRPFNKHIKALFEAHNEGKNKDVPQRKYLPNHKGEVFIITIMRAIKDVYASKIKSIINSSR